MTIPSIVVVGSLNMDLVMRMPRAPNGGETVPGHDFAMLARSEERRVGKEC